ncbi:stage V sporulation protein AC [Clostridium senegalense]|uniref:Stage V sporulation protein AC n=2 Tax=Clostridiaceae TaxID=31979 RepID=A0A6M0GZA4_9CLOT|nr:stage V sporulation protein AC [Clostridium senegalense]
MKENKLKKKFQQLYEQETPKPNLIKNCFRAFWTGGLICTIGQAIYNVLLRFGISVEQAKVYLPIIMIFIGASLTGIGVYDKIGDYAGAGSVVPITGFANSVVSPAIEFKKEGYVLGVGAKIFTIAGPVLAYGTTASVILGLLYYFIRW